MLKCEGYMMFRGKATIQPVSKSRKSYVEEGDWLYKPEHDCWYVNGSSYPAEIVEDIVEEVG